MKLSAPKSSVSVVETKGRAGHSTALRKALYIYGQSVPAYELTSSISVSSSSTLSVRGVNSTFRKRWLPIFSSQNMAVMISCFRYSHSRCNSWHGNVTFGQDQSESHARDRMVTSIAQRKRSVSSYISRKCKLIDTGEVDEDCDTENRQLSCQTARQN